MTYQVLARKYRPQSLKDLIGQEALVQILTNAIKHKRLPHAFILTGVRGVGKTTTARIIARMLNCIGADGQGQETTIPCGKCPQCQAIIDDRHIDVMEMDAATRTGVDDIRDVIEAARYKPALGRYKIYIIDEVHMLSKNAFNALLKTLEEPPQHVKFIFATTEIKRVPDTVLSRCIRFELKRFTESALMQLFHHVLKCEKLKAEPAALKLLTKVAKGSARDGLSFMDQALNYDLKCITESSVRKMLNMADCVDTIMSFQHILMGQIEPVMRFFNAYYENGGEPVVIMQEFLEICHYLSLNKAQVSIENNYTYSDQEQDLLQKISDQVSISILTRLWQVLNQAIHEVNTSTSPAQAVQMVIIRLIYLSSLPTPEQIIDTVIHDASLFESLPFKTADIDHRKQMIPQIEPFKESRLQDPTGMVKADDLNISDQEEIACDQQSNQKKKKTISTKPKISDDLTLHTSQQLQSVNTLEDDQAAESTTLWPTFESLVDFVKQQKEPLFLSFLKDDVHLISYKFGHITFRLNHHNHKVNLAVLRQKLPEWSNRQWIIDIQETGGDLPLSEQETRLGIQQGVDIENHDFIKAVVEFFPGAEIERIEE